jgi:OOP family OmpA-OmpF porin
MEKNMSLTLRNLVAVSCALMAGSAVAAEMDTRAYIAPSINYTIADKAWGMDDTMGFGVAVGKPVSQSFNVELNANYASHSIKAPGSGSADNIGLSVDALYFFSRNPDFAPYLVAGIGGLNTKATGFNETNFAANAGIGFMKMFSGVGVRSDIRYRYTDNVGTGATSINPGDWIVSAGLVIPLGAAPVAPAPYVAPAPAPAPYVAPAPAPAPVVAPAPAPVVHTIIKLEGTNFDFNKATLRPTGKAKLDEDAVTLTNNPDVVVDITGYTDSVGSAAYNKKLSEKRAITVKKYLESKGIAADRMTTKGMGKDNPVASNKTKEGRAENRRVELDHHAK